MGTGPSWWQWVSQGHQGQWEQGGACSHTTAQLSTFHLHLSFEWSTLGHKEMLSEVQRLLRQCMCLAFFWLSEPTLQCLITAWKCSFSLHQGPLFCSSVIACLLQPNPKRCYQNCFCFILLWPHHTCSLFQALRGISIRFIESLFSISFTSVFIPLLYPVLMALVHHQKPFLTLPFGFSFTLLARPCLCHSSCSHQRHSLPQHETPVQSLGTVKETSYAALALGSWKSFPKRPDTSWDLPGARQGSRKVSIRISFRPLLHLAALTSEILHWLPTQN